MDFKAFKQKYQYKEVEEYSNEVENTPVVSVCVQTYQHADYIEECLEGILMQQTDFPIEILLGEDDSTDGTRELCIEYAQKYPDKIRLFLHHRENNIKIGGQPSGRFNFLYNLYAARGKYIAFCEGDDYWTDPSKLQKQVEFMEEHEGLTMVAHQAERVGNNGPMNEVFPCVQSTFLQPWKVIMKGGGYFATNSVMLSNELLQNKKYWEWLQQFPVGDTALYYLANEYGRIGFLNQVMCAYRVNSTGSWTSKQTSKKRIKRFIRVIKCNHKIFKKSRHNRYKLFYLFKQAETMKRIFFCVGMLIIKNK